MDNILFVPGNHDAWNGKGRVWHFITSYLIPLKERWIQKSYLRYPKREMPRIFSKFTDIAGFTERRIINEKIVDFILINTSVPNDMARGIFPLSTNSVKDDADLRVSLMHHHLITDISKTYVDEQYFSKVRAMRVLNPHHAFNYIFQNQISISLHGHKHLQYYRKEPRPDSTDVFVNLISAPSLSENHYDENEGEIIGNNILGFNILILDEKDFGFYPYLLKLDNFVLKDYKLCKYR